MKKETLFDSLLKKKDSTKDYYDHAGVKAARSLYRRATMFLVLVGSVMGAGVGYEIGWGWGVVVGGVFSAIVPLAWLAWILVNSAALVLAVVAGYFKTKASQEEARKFVLAQVAQTFADMGPDVVRVSDIVEVIEEMLDATSKDGAE